MRRLPAPRLSLRSAVVFAALVASGTLGAVACLGPEEPVVWICLNPVTGKIDTSYHDDDHYVNGVADPCHCYDPCGPAISCPMVVDAGPLPPTCDAGDGGP